MTALVLYFSEGRNEQNIFQASLALNVAIHLYIISERKQLYTVEMPALPLLLPKIHNGGETSCPTE